MSYVTITLLLMCLTCYHCAVLPEYKSEDDLDDHDILPPVSMVDTDGTYESDADEYYDDSDPKTDNDELEVVDSEWIDMDCPQSIQHNDILEVDDEPSTPYGCIPGDEECPTGSSEPGPPTDLKTEIVFNNHSGSCGARVFVNWKAPLTGLDCLQGFSVTLFMQMGAQACVQLTFKHDVNVSLLSNISHMSFSYNCFKLNFNHRYYVIVGSIPLSDSNIVSSHLLIISPKYEEDPCSPMLQSAEQTNNGTDLRLTNEVVNGEIPPAMVLILPPRVVDLYILIPLVLCALFLVALVIVFLFRVLRDRLIHWQYTFACKQGIKDNSALSPNTTEYCPCRHCELQKARFVPPVEEVDGQSEHVEKQNNCFISPSECSEDPELSGNESYEEMEKVYQSFRPPSECSEFTEALHNTRTEHEGRYWDNERISSSSIDALICQSSV